MDFEAKAGEFGGGRDGEIEQVEAGGLAGDLLVGVGHGVELGEAVDLFEAVGDPGVGDGGEVLAEEADDAGVDGVGDEIEEEAGAGRGGDGDVERSVGVAGNGGGEDFAGAGSAVWRDDLAEGVDALEFRVDFDGRGEAEERGLGGKEVAAGEGHGATLP